MTHDLVSISKAAANFIECTQCKGSGVDSGGLFENRNKKTVCLTCTGSGVFHENGDLLTNEEILIYRAWQVQQARLFIKNQQLQVNQLRQHLNDVRIFITDKAKDYVERWGKKESQENYLPEALRSNERGPLRGSRAD